MSEARTGIWIIKFPSKVAIHPVVGACVTVTSTGLPVVPVAVTRMVAVRAVLLVFAVKLQVIVPESVPIAPMRSKASYRPNSLWLPRAWFQLRYLKR